MSSYNCANCALKLQKLSNKSNLKESGASSNSSIHCKIVHYGKSSTSIFHDIFASNDKIHFGRRSKH